MPWWPLNVLEVIKYLGKIFVDLGTCCKGKSCHNILSINSQKSYPTNCIDKMENLISLLQSKHFFIRTNPMAILKCCNDVMPKNEYKNISNYFCVTAFKSSNLLCKIFLTNHNRLGGI